MRISSRSSRAFARMASNPDPRAAAPGKAGPLPRPPLRPPALKAVRRLELQVKAIVRKLTDDELVLAQGKENAERRNLSFIERAFSPLRS